MKTTKNALIFLALQTLTLTVAVAVAPVVAQSGAGLSFQPAALQPAPLPSVLIQEALTAESAVPDEVSYLEQVSQLEIEYGPYDRRLAEPLQAAAVALEERSAPLQAAELYERALHITRINDGLYSESQIAIVEKLIYCLASMEDWGQVDKHYRYLHLLYTRLYEPGSVELDRGLAQISDWHVIAINNDIGSGVKEHLHEASKLFRQQLALAEQYGQVDDQAVELLRRNLEITQYHLRVMNSEVSASMFDQLGASIHDQLAQTD